MSNKIDILRTYLKYKNMRFKDRAALEKYQEKKISKQLDFVTSHSRLYEKYKGKPLSDYPLMDKKQMMEHFDELNTVGTNRDEAMKLAIDSERSRDFFEKLNHITVGLSSGTSDTRGIFLVSDKEKDTWAGYILSKVLYGSILGKYEVAFFMRANSNLYESVSSSNIHFVFYDIYKDVDDNIRKLLEQKPDIIVGQPSILLDLCRVAKDLHPKKVISIAEVLEDRDREEIKKAFNVDVIHQVYQCTEGCLATTCEHGTIHLNEDIVHVEKEYLDDRRFIPVITDFTRTSQPIIRYRLNDILVERKDPCPCGSCFTALERIEGREDDVFVFDGEGNKKVEVFPDFIRRLVLFAGDVSDYRIVQTEDGSMEVYWNENDAMKDKFMTELKKMASDRGFDLPEVKFYTYSFDRSKKLKRVESRRKRK